MTLMDGPHKDRNPDVCVCVWLKWNKDKKEVKDKTPLFIWVTWGFYFERAQDRVASCGPGVNGAVSQLNIENPFTLELWNNHLTGFCSSVSLFFSAYGT